MRRHAALARLRRDAPAEARLAIVDALLAAGANPRDDAAGETALHAAAARGPLALVERLIVGNALEWQPDRKGRVALAGRRSAARPPTRRRSWSCSTAPGSATRRSARR